MVEKSWLWCDDSKQWKTRSKILEKQTIRCLFYWFSHGELNSIQNAIICMKILSNFFMIDPICGIVRSKNAVHYSLFHPLSLSLSLSHTLSLSLSLSLFLSFALSDSHFLSSSITSSQPVMMGVDTIIEYHRWVEVETEPEPDSELSPGSLLVSMLVYFLLLFFSFLFLFLFLLLLYHPTFFMNFLFSSLVLPFLLSCTSFSPLL